MDEFGFVYMYVYAYCCIFSDREQVSDGMEGSWLFVFICCWLREEEGEREAVMVRGMGIVMGKGGFFMDDGVEIINRALF